MKIAILTSGILPVPAVKGGAVENLVDFYLAYNEQHRQHDITVYSVAPRTTPWTKARRLWYRWTHRQGYYHYSVEYFLHEALKDIRRRRYDVIVLENRPAYALRLRGMTDARLVYHLHNDLLNSTTRRAREIYDAAWRIVTVSDYLATRVRTIQPDDAKCRTVYNGIRLQDFATARDASRNAHRGFTLIFCGRLIPEKGILPLVQAMQLLKAYTDIRLLVLGSAALGSNTALTPFLQQLREAAAGLDSITFAGYVDYSQMGRYLRQADAAVVPSLWDEPFGLTCAEALAAGLPLITTRRGGIPEVVDERCAVMLTADERLPQRLADAIVDLYRWPERRRQLATAARERARRFDQDTYARNFFDAIEATDATQPS